MNVMKLESEGGVVALKSPRLDLVRGDHALPGRSWAEAALAGENRVLEMIAGGRSLLSILEALCLAVEEICHGSLCSVLLLDAKGERLWQGAAPSLPQSYLAAFDGREIASCWGPCGAAAIRMEQVIAADIQADPLWGGCRDVVLSHGLRACWSTPIFSAEERVLGTLAILSRQPCSPTPEDQGIIKQFTHLASIAIERTRSEEALRRSEAYLVEAQKLSHTGSFGWNLAAGKLVWSAETFRILGYEPTLTPTLEMVLHRIHPDDVKVVRERIERATREGSGFDLEHRLLMPNGTAKHLHVVARPSRTESGDVELLGAIMDITERKQAQEASRAAMARFEGVLDIAEDAIISVNSDQRIILFNQGAEKAFGYAAAEVIGQSLDILLPPRFATKHRAHIEAFAKSPEVSRLMGQRWELFGSRKDGSEFPAEASISKLNLGAEVVFTVILRDITERNRAEENLRQSEADLHEAQRLTHVGSWKRDLLAGKVKVSPEVHRIFQIQPHEDASDPQLYRGRVHPEDRQRVLDLFDRCQRKKIAYQVDFRIVLPDGTIRRLHSVGRPVLNQAGDAVEFVGTAMDVTEQKEAQEALHASEHIARGQVEALTSTLTALARESDPDRLLEHVLRTIVEQTQAHSIAVWNRNEDGVRFDLIAVIEDDQYQTNEEAIHPARRLSMLPGHHPVWREMLRTGQHGMMDDIDKESVKMCVGSGDWRRLVEDIDPDPAFTILMNHLREMGVRADLFVPILVAGNVAGMLAIRFQEKRTFHREDFDLTGALAHQAMLALQLMRLSQQSRQAAVMAERNRMARDIHDTLAQGFTGVIMQLEAVEEAMSQGLTAKAGERSLARASWLARACKRRGVPCGLSVCGPGGQRPL